jgi:hypothetical protein
MVEGGGNDFIQGSVQIINDAYNLRIYPVQTGTVRWTFFHSPKYLPLKEVEVGKI